MLYRKKIILGKIEGAYGTDPVPTGAADALLVWNCSIVPVDAELVDRAVVRHYLGHDEQIPVATRMRVAFEVEMVGSGTLGTAPAWGKLLRACGFAETVSPGVSVAYSPVSENFASIAFHYHQDGLRHIALGCRGSVSLRMTPRGIPMFAFNFVGLYGGVTDQALPTPTMTAWKTPIAVNNANTSAFALHGFAGKLYDQSIDKANAVTYRNLVGGEDVQIVDRAPAGSIEIEAPTVAAKDFYPIARNATLGALTITHGVTNGFKVKVDAPAVQLINPEYTDRDGVLGMRMGLRLNPTSAGNDELVITSI